MDAHSIRRTMAILVVATSCGGSEKSPPDGNGTPPEGGLTAGPDASVVESDDGGASEASPSIAVDSGGRAPALDDASMDDSSEPVAEAGAADGDAQVAIQTDSGATGAMDAARSGPGAAGPVVAFPGAVGVGRVATGGRGGTVVHVTTLNDSGAGSFRDAVSARGRIVVFDVGGYIALSSALSVSGDITIAGQTAPGDGIGVMGREVSFSGASNVVVRYFRFRQGALDPDSSKSGINLLNGSKMVFDHVSIEFAQWNNIDAVGASNVTVQNSIDADPIGQQFAAHTETGPYTWYRNLFANAHNRCPLAKANTEYVDNVVYNYQLGYTAGNTSGVFSHDVLNNYFIAGPSTSNPGDAFFQVDNQPMYAMGNLQDPNADGTLMGAPLSIPSTAVAAKSPWSALTSSLPTGGAAQAYATVLAGVGASLHRDSVDATVIADVKSLGTAGHMWTTQTQTGLGNSGYGTLAGGMAPLDTDGDGMPDAWETRYGLNPKSATDANGDFDKTGYTNIEKYINGLVDGSYP